MLVDILEELFIESRSLFPPNIPSKDRIREYYHCYRTFRRTSDTRAIEKGVAQTDIDIVNKWQKIEKAKGRRPKEPMRRHYAQTELLIGPFKRYTFPM